jgi:hypothetical protein
LSTGQVIYSQSGSTEILEVGATVGPLRLTDSGWCIDLLKKYHWLVADNPNEQNNCVVRKIYLKINMIF